MIIDFTFFLTLIVLVTGIIALLDTAFWRQQRLAALGVSTKAEDKPPLLIDYARSFFPVLLLVLIIRSFLFQPVRVPTGSLEPTVMPGDLIAVNQFAYGLRLPVLNSKILSISEPKVGDIVVFRWPVDEKVNFVKRIVGTPGDHVVYQNKQLTINGRKIPQTYLHDGVDVGPGDDIPVQVKQEDLLGVKHHILVNPFRGDFHDVDVVVPNDKYFVLGDNRDDSTDSRSWGFVPEKNLIGKAFYIFFSWDNKNHKVRWQHLGAL